MNLTKFDSKTLNAEAQKEISGGKLDSPWDTAQHFAFYAHRTHWKDENQTPAQKKANIQGVFDYGIWQFRNYSFFSRTYTNGFDNVMMNLGASNWRNL